MLTKNLKSRETNVMDRQERTTDQKDSLTKYMKFIIVIKIKIDY